MKFKIVVDSCCELDEKMKALDNIEIVPLTLTVSGEDVIDDDTFDQKSFIEKVSRATEEPKSSCPSPARYMEAYLGDYEAVFVVTLSSNLSGSNNSAQVGKEMYYEDHEGDSKKIHVFDSCSASVGETQLAMEIYRLAMEGKSFEEIVDQVTKFRENMNTYFVIESLETLRKNGRLTGLTAVIASVLNIKPIMTGTKEGVIAKLDQARGMEKALDKLAQYICKNVNEPENKTLMISHVNAIERAERLKEEVLKLVKFKDVVILDTAGVSTMYACDGGIIVAV
ncbi:MAG: DegV family protein [Lachnospiraceae bacterium]|nr:DegV family protein [Lachnospiraceae bacterium]